MFLVANECVKRLKNLQWNIHCKNCLLTTAPVFDDSRSYLRCWAC
jgi:hypothetical protein